MKHNWFENFKKIILGADIEKRRVPIDEKKLTAAFLNKWKAFVEEKFPQENVDAKTLKFIPK